MEADFWLQRWQEKQIGFHQEQYNSSLVTHWPTVNTGQTVFVPLCGKSQDMLFLAEQGLNVVGVELSEIAVQEFFQEQQLNPNIAQEGELTRYQDGPFTLYCGDLFKLTAEQLSSCLWVYDRASLIALPPAMRERYAKHLDDILSEQCQTLLITLEYDQSLMQGPPFSIDRAEVQRLFAGTWGIQELGAVEEDIKGLKGLEKSYRLTKS